MKLRKKHPRILLWLSMFAIACETDPLNEQNQSIDSTELKLETLNFSDFSKNNVALQKLNNVQSAGSSSLQRRSVNVKDYGYDVDTESAIRITQGEFHTITFRIQGEPDANIVENLILVSNGKDYTAYIAEYILTDKEREMLALGLKPKNIIPSTLLEVEKKASITVGGNGSNCVRVAIITKDYCDDKNGNKITHNGDNDGRCVANWTKEEYAVLFINKGCLAGSGPTTGNGNTGGVSIGPGSGGGGAGSPGREGTGSGSITEDGNTIRTTPILLQDESLRHIVALNKLTKNNRDGSKTKIKEKIDELRPRVATDFMEDGAHFIKTGADYQIRLPAARGNNWVKYSNGDRVLPNTKVVVHMHQILAKVRRGYDPTTGLPQIVNEELSPIFSDADIFKTAEQFTDLNNDKDFTSILVSEQGTFALRVGNKNDLMDTYNALISNEKNQDKLKDDFELRVLKECRASNNACYVDKFIEFLQTFQINEHPIGLVLFQAVYDNEGSIINWIKK
ncbi:hypothetical protein [Flavobacterium microcysteis]